MMLLSSVSTLSVYFGYATIFMWISSARSQCNSGSTLRALCQDAAQQNSFLENDTSPTTQSIIIMCNSQNAGALTGWSQSPGGSVTTTLLDTSPSKYMVSGNTLTITNIDRTDEGLYRCVYGQGETRELCIYVYGHAVFASCPLDFDGCTGDPLSLSVMDGGNVNFNATVIHTPGGSCGFRQRIINVQLIKRNPEFGVEDKVLLFCQTASMAACSNSRVSLNRGNDPGFEFVFTLSRANISDAGTYEVIIQGEHPSTSSLTTINKRFSIEVTPTTPTPTTQTPTTETDSPSTSLATTMSTAAEFGGNGVHSSVVVISVLVPVVSILIAVAFAIAIVFLVVYRRKSTLTDTENEKLSERRIIAQEQTHAGSGTRVEDVMVLRPVEQQPPPYYASCGPSKEMNVINNTEVPPIDPSSYSSRNSLIESDFHLPIDTNLNSKPALVTICETATEEVNI